VGQFVTVDGLRLHYTDQGAGGAVLLVHGASSNLLEFQTSLVPVLVRHHWVLAFDRPGYGYSERGDGAWPD
jgi:pimeloyl-ACP methyl ester carboxylesterase